MILPIRFNDCNLPIKLWRERLFKAFTAVLPSPVNFHMTWEKSSPCRSTRLCSAHAQLALCVSGPALCKPSVPRLLLQQLLIVALQTHTTAKCGAVSPWSAELRDVLIETDEVLKKKKVIECLTHSQARCSNTTWGGKVYVSVLIS